MKKLIFFLALSSALNLNAQITTGMNYFYIGGMSFNGDSKQLKNFPAYTDTTGVDSTVYVGKQSLDITLGYRFAIAKNLSIGIASRFVSSKESSFAISAGGLSFRYHFPLGTLGAKKNKDGQSKEHLIYKKTDMLARNFFFVDLSGLYGAMKYENQNQTYINGMLQVGGSIRLPLADYRFIRHFGLEIAGGVSYRTRVSGDYGVFPVATVGIQFYLDKKYTISAK